MTTNDHNFSHGREIIISLEEWNEFKKGYNRNLLACRKSCLVVDSSRPQTLIMHVFEDIEFLEASQEMDNINIDGWEVLTAVETEGTECTIYRKYKEDSGLYEYKIVLNLFDVNPETCKAVYLDLEYRKIWDDYVKELSEFEEDGIKGIYWHVNFPFPMSNRDKICISKYTFIRETRELEVNGKPTVVTLGRSHVFVGKPEVSGVVRVQDFHQSLIIQSNSDGNGGTKGFMRYFDNPRGMIPTWLVNWACKTAVPGFVKTMRKSCLEYPKYLESRKEKQKT